MYFRSLLKGAALTAIEGIEISGRNYKDALSMIQTRFGNSKLLISCFVDKLMKLKPVSDSKNISKLRELVDNISTCIQNLASLEVKSEAYGAVLIPCILQKIPDDLKLDVTRSVKLADWNFDELIQALNTEMQAREACQFVAKSNSSRNDSASGTQNESRTNSGMFHASTKQKFSKQKACAYCDDTKHKSWQCEKITDISERKSVVMAKRLCFNCLNSGHVSAQCRSKIACHNCQGRHHTSLCEKQVTGSECVLEGTSDCLVNNGSASNNASASKNVVFLKTARTQAINSGQTDNFLSWGSRSVEKGPFFVRKAK